MRTLVIIALAFGLSACGPSLAQMALTRVDTTRANAQQRQGPRQAQAYAEAVHDAYRQGAYGQDVARLAAEVNEAAAVIDRAAANGGPDAPTLVAWKALLLVDAGRSDEGFAEFQRSMAIGPNSMAAKNLVLVYGMANQPHKVGAICVRTVPVVTDADERYDLIEHCKDNMNAISEPAALAWATPEIRDWYAQERGRRAQQAAYQADREAQQAEVERQVGHQIDICIADSKQQGYRCINRCNGDQRCEANCESSYQAALERCEAEAKMRLGE